MAIILATSLRTGVTGGAGGDCGAARVVESRGGGGGDDDDDDGEEEEEGAGIKGVETGDEVPPNWAVVGRDSR